MQMLNFMNYLISILKNKKYQLFKNIKILNQDLYMLLYSILDMKLILIIL